MASSAVLLLSLALVFASSQACRREGVTYVNNQEWIEREAFVMRCTINSNGSWKTEVVACVLPDRTRLSINSTQEDGQTEWRCAMNDKGMVTLVQGVNPNAKCDGHAVGSTWQERSFELECFPGGVRKLKACITEDSNRVAVNSTRDVNGVKYSCQSYANGTVSFHGERVVPSVPATRDTTTPGGVAAAGAPQNQQASTTTVEYCLDENNAKKYRVGETWIENQRFNKTCKPNGYVEVVNCITKDGVQIPLNRLVVKGSTKYMCERTPQQTIRFSAVPVDESGRERRRF